MKHHSHKKEKGHHTQDITADAVEKMYHDSKIQEQFSKESKEVLDGENPIPRTSYSRKINDDEFYGAFGKDKNRPPDGISAATFEDIIRKDKLKTEFVQKYTNMFDGEPPKPRKSRSRSRNKFHKRFGSDGNRESSAGSPAVKSRNSSPGQVSSPPLPHRQPRPSLPDQPRHDVLIFSPNVTQGYEPHRMQVLYCSMDDYWKAKVTHYIDHWWDADACFASVYPILLKLEREQGPGWRLDKVSHANEEKHDAVPGCTMNFSFPPEATVYSVWRQRVHEF